MFHFSVIPYVGFRGRLVAALFGLLCPAAVTVAAADEHVYIPYSGIISGTAGAEPVELLVANNTGITMTCTAALAHWYSEDLGDIAPDGALSVILWHDPETGVINLMNATDDRMPVEAIWCGDAAAMSDTRARVELPFSIGPAPRQLAQTCTPGENLRLRCAAPEG